MQNPIERFIENRFHKSIQAQIKLDTQEAKTREYPDNLHPDLKNILQGSNIQSLYSHQAAAFESISKNEDTLIVSQTASGKTLSFFLPILNEYMYSQSPFTTLLLYPTKALSRDQEGTLGKLLSHATGNRNMGTFDGDTPRAARSKMQNSADFIITNPDMLHSGFLPNHNRRWKSFLSRLRYIVVDEVHIYRGAFGSHVSNVFRRLLRVCELHGSKPTFVCSSATISNANEHVRALMHRPFTVISQDGSPRPQRNLYLLNPETQVNDSGALYRKGPGSISVSLIREAAENGIRTICFCRARQGVERLYRAVTDGQPQLKNIIKPYRGGLLPNERRKLEKGLFNGDIKVIITTNALELGIDIGDLQLCILSGHPGSVSSFWQQAGRVGRKKNRATIVFIAKDTPVDQYMVHHPEFITSAPIEKAWLNANNPYIFLQHLPCAAYEHPLREKEELFPEKPLAHSIKILTQDKTLAPVGSFHRYIKIDYPARGVNLRGMTDYNVDIYCGTEIIGEIDPIGARGTLYKDAIYQHLGEKYISMDLDLDKKICRVEPLRVDYYTEAVWENRLALTSELTHKQISKHDFQFGYINVNKQPKLYKKIRERSFENVGYGPITLPPFEYDTTGFCLLPSLDYKAFLDEHDKRFLSSALYGLATILKKVAPSLCMGDVSNIETDVSLAIYQGKEWKSALYLYDSIEGGVGYGEKVYELITESLKLCQTIILECECKSGCPACVPPLPPGVENEELAEFMLESNATVECTRSILDTLLEGKFTLPKIIVHRQVLKVQDKVLSEDPEYTMLKQKLEKARELLTEKRERIY